MGGCRLHSKVGWPARFQTTLDVFPLSWITVVCMWCGVIPTSEGFKTNSSPLQLVNTWLRHVISAVTDQWAALRWPCCNWLASSVTFNLLQQSSGELKFHYIFKPNVHWDSCKISHAALLSWLMLFSGMAQPCQRRGFWPWAWAPL